MIPAEGEWRNSAIALFCLVLLGIYGYLLILFVSHDLISSFATDSANYLVMARYLSPWHETTPAITAAWPAQDFPVLFPLLLAISGVAHDFFLAHAITALLLVLSLPLIYKLAYAVNHSRTQSFTITALFALSPAVWVNSLGILSENLYILLSVAALLCYRQLDDNNRYILIGFGLLLAAAVLTRTIGISLPAGYCLLLAVEKLRGRQPLVPSIIPLAIAAVFILLAESLHSTTVPDQYIDQMLGLVENKTAGTELEFNLVKQFSALIDAWFVSWMYYWNSNLVITYSVFAVTGLLAIAGLVWRASKLELDAIYLLVYLVILLLWPHPGQTGRFIYPVLFLLLINAFVAGNFLLMAVTARPRRYIAIFAVLLSFFSLFPAQVYTYHRHQAGVETGCQYFREFYLRPDLNDARENCAIQLVMQQDLLDLEKSTASTARIMYFVSAYVALLSNREGVDIQFYKDDAGRVLLKRDKVVDYVYLSELHPRKTRESIDGLAVIHFFNGWTRLLKTRYSDATGKPVSFLLQTTR